LSQCVDQFTVSDAANLQIVPLVIVRPTLLSVPETLDCLCSIQGHVWLQCVDQFIIPDAANLQYVADRLNVSLHFTSQSWLTVTDGTGRLYLLHTGDRRSDDKWKVN